MAEPIDPPDLATLLADLDSLPDVAVRDKARAAVTAVLALHAEGLARVIEIAKDSPQGADLVAALANDRAVAPLLFLHGLHPQPLADRAVRATERVRGRLASYGITLEAIDIDGQQATLRLARGTVPERALAEAESIAGETFAELAPELEIVCEWQQPSGLLPAQKLLRPRAGSAAEVSSNHEVCELCAKPIGAAHDHLLAENGRDLSCACPACALLFASEAKTKWRRVVRHAASVELDLSDAMWDRLGLPVRLAFFVRRADGPHAVYPSPAGGTEMRLADGVWPALDELPLDTEALLVNHTGAARSTHRVSIDLAYELVGLLRRNWRGLGGGEAAWQSVERFFGELEGMTGGARGAHA